MKTKSLIAMLGSLLLAAHTNASAGPETIKNLNAAYRGESNAHNRYALFAEKADKDGFPQVAKLFRAASRAEQVHRDTHRAAIQKLGGTVEEFTLDVVIPGSTRENLEAAIKGESYERDTMYPEFLKQAEATDASPAVRSFTFALAAEKEHAQLYKAALENLGNNARVDYYVCTVCGNTLSVLPEKKCPVCRNKLDKFEKII
jgi:rubrerythrin